mmetsp:Transcript_2872/g.6729  ORF Transcript_2872/g.6729 Transcript_2872/m.6729 type:complete len:262 (-) Transcript_2872:316-1101(-)
MPARISRPSLPKRRTSPSSVWETPSTRRTGGGGSRPPTATARPPAARTAWRLPTVSFSSLVGSVPRIPSTTCGHMILRRTSGRTAPSTPCPSASRTPATMPAWSSTTASSTCTVARLPAKTGFSTTSGSLTPAATSGTGSRPPTAPLPTRGRRSGMATWPSGMGTICTSLAGALQRGLRGRRCWCSTWMSLCGACCRRCNKLARQFLRRGWCTPLLLTAMLSMSSEDTRAGLSTGSMATCGRMRSRPTGGSACWIAPRSSG